MSFWDYVPSDTQISKPSSINCKKCNNTISNFITTQHSTREKLNINKYSCSNYFRIALGNILGFAGGSALLALGGYYLYSSEIGSMDFLLGVVMSVGGGVVVIDEMKQK
ncbi:hypothetical protein ACTFIY_004567 [Dictyostelium cf. discoideum]